jgi:hypothetical protein
MDIVLLLGVVIRCRVCIDCVVGKFRGGWLFYLGWNTAWVRGGPSSVFCCGRSCMCVSPAAVAVVLCAGV